MVSAILGDWTHRRGDAGGARAIPAEVDRARPTVAWSWQPEHGGRVDQVRVAAGTVIVATMMPRDPGAPGWEHAVVYVLDAATGAERARRILPDPVPVAAMAVEAGSVHIVATRKAEPIFWYALSVADLVPVHRRIATIAGGVRHEDVLDAWATPDGGLWLELDAPLGADAARVHVYAFADPSGTPAVVRMTDEHQPSDGPPLASDACAGGRELFVPVEGRWGGALDAAAPSVSRLGPSLEEDGRQDGWARAAVLGRHAQVHSLASEGVVCALAAAEDPERPDRVRVEALAIDRGSGVVRWRAQHDKVAMRPQLGDAARVARRPNGELLFQSLDGDGTACSPLLCARPDGQIDEILLGARGRYVLDASLGDLVLAHREGREGRAEVAGFDIDQEGRLLGRRAVARWAIDVGDLGGEITVYAGAGAVVVRGARGVSAVHL